MSTLGERKCALILASVDKRDRQILLGQLPADSARRIRLVLAELDAMAIPLQSLAAELLGDEMLGLTAHTSLDLEQLVDLSQRLPAPWFARVLSVWTGVDRNFCLEMLESQLAGQVRHQLKLMPVMPSKLVEAIKAEALAMAGSPQRKVA